MQRKKNQDMTEEERQQMELRRVKLPHEGQTLGICERRLGGSRMEVRCLDGKTRNCRIPGRKKRRLWVREGDLLLIEPWELGGDEKGDVLFKYKPIQVEFLRRKGYLDKLDTSDEF